jgi:hypothetical protein
LRDRVGVVEIEHRQPGRRGQHRRAVGRNGDHERVVRILRGLSGRRAPHLDLGERRVLESLDQDPVAIDQLGEQLLDARLSGLGYSRILGRRRFDAMTTSKAPAWRCRHESLPSWSMSNSWCACLTTETRRPARRSCDSCSTSVVLPDPE